MWWSASPASHSQLAADSICQSQQRPSVWSVSAPIARCPSVGQLPRPASRTPARPSCPWNARPTSGTDSRNSSAYQRHSASQSLRARCTSSTSGEGSAPSSRLLTERTVTGVSPSLRSRTRARSTGTASGEEYSTKTVRPPRLSWSWTVRWCQPSPYAAWWARWVRRCPSAVPVKRGPDQPVPCPRRVTSTSGSAAPAASAAHLGSGSPGTVSRTRRGVRPSRSKSAVSAEWPQR